MSANNWAFPAITSCLTELIESLYDDFMTMFQKVTFWCALAVCLHASILHAGTVTVSSTAPTVDGGDIDTIGATVSAVKVRAHRGYKQMRALLDEEPVKP